MPNRCFYEMKIRGTKENVKEFIKILQADYHCQKFFWEIFDVTLIDSKFDNNENYALVCGNCAWSVYFCMFDGVNTCNYEFPNSKGTTLEKESERLNLTIEVFAEEPLSGIMEHYVFTNGNIVVKKCVDYLEYDTYGFESVKELNGEYGTNFTQEQFDENEFLTIGGFPWIYDCWES